MSDEINITGSGPQNTPRGNTGGRPSFSLSSDLQRQAAAAARSITAEQKAAIAAFKEIYREASTENKGYNTKLRAALTQQKNEHRATLSDAWDENRSFDKRRQAAYRTSSAYYATKEIGHLGYQGTKAINNGSLKELIMIDRHLAKMDRNLEKYVKTNGLSSQEQDARRKTARSALSSSYSQLSAAAEGAPGFKGWASRAIMAHRAGGGGGIGRGGRGFGGRIGGAMLGAAGMGLEGLEMAAGPVGWAAAAAGAVYEAPNAISDIYSSMYGAAKPYYNLQRSAGRMGLAGAAAGGPFGNGQAIMDSFYNSNDPSKIPSWMQQLGITPQDAMRTLSQYGLVANGKNTGFGSGSPADTVKYVAGLKYNPAFSQLSDSDRVQFARNQTLTGDSSQGTLDKIGATMTKAFVDGADSSAVLKSIENATMQAAANGGQGGMSGILSLNNRLLDSGASGAKTGAMQASLTSSIGDMYTNLGKNPLTSMPFLSYINAHGGVKAGAKALPPEIYAKLAASNNPNDQRLLQDLNSNTSPLQYMQYYGVAMQGSGDLGMQILDKWNQSQGLSGGQSDYLSAQQLNTPLGSSIAYHSNSGNGTPLTKANGKKLFINPAVADAIQKASVATGVPVNVLQGIIGAESGFNPNASNSTSSARGLGQLERGARQDVGLSDGDVSNPYLNAKGTGDYYNKMYALFPGVKDPNQRMYDSFLAYNMGPGSKNNILNGNVDKGYLDEANIKMSQAGIDFSSQKTSSGIAYAGQNTNLAQSGNSGDATAGTLATIVAQKTAVVFDQIQKSFSDGALKVSAESMSVTNMVVQSFVSLGSSTTPNSPAGAATAGPATHYNPRAYAAPRQP